MPGGYGAQNECFCKFGKKVFLDPWRQEGGLGGILPISRAYLAPWHQEGGLGGSSPHYRAYLTPLSEEGVGGILPPILGRTRPPGVNRGGPGRGGSNGAGLVRGISRGVVVVCSLSVCSGTN